VKRPYSHRQDLRSYGLYKHIGTRSAQVCQAARTGICLVGHNIGSYGHYRGKLDRSRLDLCRPQARYEYQSRGLDTAMRETFGYAVTQAVTYVRELSDSNHFPQSVLDAIRRARRLDLNDQVIALDSEGPKLVFAD